MIFQKKYVLTYTFVYYILFMHEKYIHEKQLLFLIKLRRFFYVFLIQFLNCTKTQTRPFHQTKNILVSSIRSIDMLYNPLFFKTSVYNNTDAL